MYKFTLDEKHIREYLDGAINNWRKIRDKQGILSAEDVRLKSIAPNYVDAFQSVRMSLLGELLEK